jgi:hypothetical protein
MRRREFIAFVGGVAVLPLAVGAQPTTAPRLGVLLVDNREPFSRLFSEGLRDLGYIDGRNIQIEIRSAQGNLSQLPELGGPRASQGRHYRCFRNTRRYGREACNE